MLTYNAKAFATIIRRQAFLAKHGSNVSLAIAARSAAARARLTRANGNCRQLAVTAAVIAIAATLNA